jgi:hypothetical protein
MTFGAALIGVGLSLWSVRYDYVKKQKARRALRDGSGEA